MTTFQTIFQIPIPLFPPQCPGFWQDLCTRSRFWSMQVFSRDSVIDSSIIYSPYLHSLPSGRVSDRTSVPGHGSGPCRFSDESEAPSPVPWTGWSLGHPYLLWLQPVGPRSQRSIAISFWKCTTENIFSNLLNKHWIQISLIHIKLLVFTIS